MEDDDNSVNQEMVVGSRDPESGEVYTSGRFEMSSRRPFKTVGIVHKDGSASTTREVVLDEPRPRGEGEAPSPVTSLFSSLVGCQMSVLAVCLTKARIEDYKITVEAEMEKGLDETTPDDLPPNLSQRIKNADITLELEVPEEKTEQAQRCLDVYDDGCIVGQSLKAGIDYTYSTTLTSK